MMSRQLHNNIDHLNESNKFAGFQLHVLRGFIRLVIAKNMKTDPLRLVTVPELSVFPADSSR